jgi:integrase
MRALSISYYASAAFRSMRASTQYERRGTIDRFCREHGDKSAAGLQPKHVRAMVDALLDKPGAAGNLRKALRELMRHAIEIGLRSDNPAREVRLPRSNSEGHHTWTEEEIEQFEKRHPIGTRERLALALLLYTGQRRGDVIRLGHQHVRGGVLSIRQEKTGAELSIPLHPRLAKILAGTPRENLTFIVTKRGRPFGAVPFSTWFRKACDAAGLSSRCCAHGLRKAAARRLAEAGCSTFEVAAITGHASLRELERYTKAAAQGSLPPRRSPRWRKGEHPLANFTIGLPKIAKNPFRSMPNFEGYHPVWIDTASTIE